MPGHTGGHEGKGFGSGFKVSFNSFCSFSAFVCNGFFRGIISADKAEML